jgi:hypothetical protein
LVRVVKRCVVAGDVLEPGEQRTLPLGEAARLVSAGQGRYASLRCRVIFDCLVETTWRLAGEVVDVPVDLALTLRWQGALEIIDAAALPAGTRLAPVPPRPKREPPPDPYAGMPTAKVKVLKPFLAGRESFDPGVTVAIPEPLAAEAVAAGAAEFVGIDAITDRCQKFLQALLSPSWTTRREAQY